MDIGDVLIWEATNGLLLISHSDRSCRAGALVSWTARVQREGLALSVWSFAQGSFLAAVVAQIRGAFAAGRARWPRYRVLRLTLWPRMVRGRCTSHHSGHFAYCAEMAAMKVHKYAAQKKKPFTDDYLRRLDSGFHRRTDDTAD